MTGKHRKDPTYRLLKLYLVCAAPLLIIMALQPDAPGLELIRDVDLIGISAWLIGIGLTLIVGWKAIRELRG